MEATALEIEQVNKWYAADVHAVRDVNLAVEPGEFMIFVGPSGCGKSTLLRMVAGLERVDSGVIRMDGKSIHRVPPRDRDIAMVFQNYALYPTMKVYDNMAFPLKMRRWGREEIRARVMEVAESLGLLEYLDRRPGALSGGQRQRVALGRALVRRPRLFLMDEPLSNLDAKLRVDMRREIVSFQRDLGTTTVYVTHDQTEAMTLGDRIVIMKDGFIQQIGTPQEVFDQPANLFVAGFIGSPQMNFFDGELEKKDGKYQLKVGEATVVLGGKAQELLAGKGVGERKVTVGIRPEHIAFAAAPGTDTVSSKVDVSEMMGSEIHLHVNAGGKDVVLRIPTTELAEEQRGGMGYGTELHFTFREDLVHLFDPETGKNLL